MAAQTRTHITTSVGQTVGRVVMELDGVLVPVVPISVAACRLGYSPRYVRYLCDVGKLIAIKIEGRWWIPERGIEIWPQTAVLRESTWINLGENVIRRYGYKEMRWRR